MHSIRSIADQKQLRWKTRGAISEHTTCIAFAALPAKYETKYSVFKAEEYDTLAYSLCKCTV